ncbi:MAG: hypothetical protein H7289_05770 [Mucilaginibacter sp.]|nr:hypothetical protein [Mucilaginibacter sp.]
MLVFITLWILLINSVGSYGKDTVLGYWGTVLLALFTTPVTAFIIVAIIRWINPPANSNA